MPTVPIPSGTNLGATGESPLTAKPSPENILMAIAIMHQMGKFTNPVGETAKRPRGLGGQHLKVVK